MTDDQFCGDDNCVDVNNTTLSINSTITSNQQYLLLPHAYKISHNVHQCEVESPGGLHAGGYVKFSWQHAKFSVLLETCQILQNAERA